MAETTVFSDTYLRRNIFTYIRSKPHAACVMCHRMIMWNPGQKICDYVRFYNNTYYCTSCAQMELHGVGCTIG